MTSIGFLGFGEVAAHFSAALARNGADVSAYDVLLDSPDGADRLAARVRENAPIRFLPLAPMARADLVLSTVTTDVALEAARGCAPHLRPGSVFVDLNATSPGVKRAIEAVITAAGADFVEGAILPAVGVAGARAKVLVCGASAAAVAQTLNGFGLNVVAYGEEIGRAASFKMLRSVFSKGLEALLIECRLAALRAGVEDDLWREIVATIDADGFEAVGSNWLRTHATAHARRMHEMVEVEALVRELGLEPIMTAATRRLFERSTRLALKSDFDRPAREAGDVIAALDARLRAETDT